MPPLHAGAYLVDYLFRIGPTNGDKALSGPDLVAWEHLLGIQWQPYQAELLARLSKEYLGEMHQATKRDATPPWEAFEKPWRWVQRQAGERRLNAFLR